MNTDAAATRPLRVFVTYAHENAEHIRLVEQVATILRDHGVDVFLDRWREDQRNDWNQLTTAELTNADYVVAVVSPGFNEAACSDNGSPGVTHELSIIRDLLHGDRAKWRPRIVPLVLPQWTVDDIPLFMQPRSATRFVVDEVSEAGLAKLLAILAKTPETAPRAMLSSLSRLATLAGRHWLAAGVCGVALAGGLVVAASRHDGDLHAENGSAAGQGNSVQVSGACANVGNDSSCVVEADKQVRELDQSTSSDAGMRALLSRRAKKGAPSGDGPWPFVVIDTIEKDNDPGLFARTSGDVRAEHLGVAFDHSVIWADCEERTDFRPPAVQGETDVGPRWLHVRWAPVAPMAPSVSEPSQREHAWMYRGHLLPLDHNGHIPPC